MFPLSLTAVESIGGGKDHDAWCYHWLQNWAAGFAEGLVVGPSKKKKLRTISCLCPNQIVSPVCELVARFFPLHVLQKKIKKITGLCSPPPPRRLDVVCRRVIFHRVYLTVLSFKDV